MSDPKNTKNKKTVKGESVAGQIEQDWLSKKPEGLKEGTQLIIPGAEPEPPEKIIPQPGRVTAREVTVTDGSKAHLQVVNLEPRSPDTNLKAEQNFACEFPVCVGNRRDVGKPYIELANDIGGHYRLSRSADSLLAAPEHYPHFLWAIEAFIRSTKYVEDCPAIEINPPEIYDMFGGPVSSKRTYGGGSWYDKLEEGFKRFAKSTVSQSGMIYDATTKRTIRGGPTFHLFDFASWRADPQEKQNVFDFAKGYLICSPLLWLSIKKGKYLKSVPLEPLKNLSYVGQRLYMYLSKHCPPGGQFKVSAQKLLPKIPITCPPDQIKRRLYSSHDALVQIGFLRNVVIEGRGINKSLTYFRS
jgi:hypothetical protein